MGIKNLGEANIIQLLELLKAELEESNSGGQSGDCLPLTGGEMSGPLVAQSNDGYTVAQVRNVTMSTEVASGGSNGQVHFTYV